MGGLTGVLLLGGASSRFGAPKALARFQGETLAERAWRTLGEACDERLAVGKGDLVLPFDVVVEPAEPTAPIVGVIAGLRAATHDAAVFLPVDCPLVTPELLRKLGEAGAVTQTGPLPGAYSKSDLPELERRLGSGELSLRNVNRSVLSVDARLLVDADTRSELARLEQSAMAVRRYEPRDRPEVLALHRAGLQQMGADLPGPWDSDLEDVDAAYLASGGEFLVGTIGGEVVAMGALRRVDPTTADLKRLRVKQEYQSAGIGERIARALEQRAIDLGYVRLTADTTSMQIPAQRLLAKLGFRERARKQVDDLELIFYER